MRLGFGRQHDAAPPSWFEPMQAGDRELRMKDYHGRKVITEEDMERLLSEYYQARGWNQDTGAPLPEKLEALGLDGFAV